MKHALQVLEFEEIKQRLARHCESELSLPLAHDLTPSTDPEQVWTDLALTGQAHDLIAKHSPPSLGAVRDLRSAFRRAQKGGVLGGMELYLAGEALMAMRSFRSFIKSRSGDYPALWPAAESLPEAQKVEDRIFQSLDGSGEVKDSASPELQRLRQKKQGLTQRIVERIQSYVSKSRDLLSDPLYTTRDGRYVIPVKAENKNKIKGIVHDTSGSGQTVFIEPEDVLQLGNNLREAEAAEREEVQRILEELSGRLGAIASDALPGFEAVAFLDLALAKARLAFAMHATMPIKWSGHGIDILDGYHPLLERDKAIPLNIRIGFDDTGLLITGPNTGGKTIAIKTVGLLALMAQSGLLVPASEVRLGPFTQVWADIGDEQSLQQSLSTFSGHIKNIAEAIKGIEEGALVLLDEVGAGTDPAEGAALAKAILLELQRRGAKIVASTHYGELKVFAYNAPGFQNAAMEFDQKTLRPTYRLLMGAPGASHALKIAERYGIPKEVVEQAKAGLSEEHQDVAEMLQKLEQAQRQARIAQSEADRKASELKRAEAQAARKLAEADEIRRTAHSRANAAIEEALREIRMEAANIFEALKNAPRDQRALDETRKKLSQLQQVSREFADELVPAPERAREAAQIKKGDSVKVEGYSQTGTVLSEPKEGQASVQIGALKFTVPVSSLQPVKATAPPPAPKSAGAARLQKAQTASTEIHLRAMRAEEAMRQLESFLDEAVLAGLPQVRIVHGKGTGVLRKLTRDALRTYPHVASYRDGEPSEGGDGVTIAVLK